MATFRSLPFPSVPRRFQSGMCHALVSTMEISKLINHGVDMWCHLMLDLLNATPGNTVTSATTISAHTAKGMISMEMDRIWEKWVNERIWKAWQ